MTLAVKKSDKPHFGIYHFSVIRTVSGYYLESMTFSHIPPTSRRHYASYNNSPFSLIDFWNEELSGRREADSLIVLDRYQFRVASERKYSVMGFAESIIRHFKTVGNFYQPGLQEFL